MKEKYIKAAIKQALLASKKDEVPVGAVIVKNNKIIAKAYNKVEKKKNATLHAEMLVIKQASKKLKSWRLNECELYVTLEPCPMCEYAIKLCRIKKTYYCVSKSKIENNFSYSKEKINIYEKEYLGILQSFFKKKR